MFRKINGEWVDNTVWDDEIDKVDILPIPFYDDKTTPTIQNQQKA